MGGDIREQENKIEQMRSAQLYCVTQYYMNLGWNNLNFNVHSRLGFFANKNLDCVHKSTIRNQFQEFRQS